MDEPPQRPEEVRAPRTIGRARNPDYTNGGKIRRTYRWTPTTIDVTEVKNPPKNDYYPPVMGRQTNILLNVPIQRLLAYPESPLAIAEIHRRTILDEMKGEADSGLADIAAVGYADLDYFELLDLNQDGQLDTNELHVLADLLGLGTGQDLQQLILGETKDSVRVTTEEFDNWFKELTVS